MSTLGDKWRARAKDWGRGSLVPSDVLRTCANEHETWLVERCRLIAGLPFGSVPGGWRDAVLRILREGE